MIGFSILYASSGCSYIPFCELIPTHSYSGLQIPSDFPPELKMSCGKIERRESILSPSGEVVGQNTEWVVSQNIGSVESFFSKAIKEPDYLIIRQDTRNAVAQKRDIQYEVKIEPIDEQSTKITVIYKKQATTSTQVEAKPEIVSEPVTQESTSTLGQFIDLDEVPPHLRKKLDEVLALGLIQPSASSNLFRPNDPISRETYTQWLVRTFNLFNKDSLTIHIALPSPDDTPIYQDVTNTNPNFIYIQGITKTGLISSPLTNSKNKLFHPTKNLTRDEFILLKLPLDMMKELPRMNQLNSCRILNQQIDFRKQINFIDAEKISPTSACLLLADQQKQNGSTFNQIFGNTLLFLPQSPVSRAEAAASLWSFGFDSLNATNIKP